MNETNEPRLCNGIEPSTAAATAELIRGGLADVTKLDDQMLGAVLVWTVDTSDHELNRVVYEESVIRSVLCHWCASFALRSFGVTERWRVVHEADCLIWQRYQQRAGGYTALPSGDLWSCDQPWPQGAQFVLVNSPLSPCGAVVTWRGPYASEAAQEAARAQAVRAGTGLAVRAAQTP
jgi:hypothetical protein